MFTLATSPRLPAALLLTGLALALPAARALAADPFADLDAAPPPPPPPPAAPGWADNLLLRKELSLLSAAGRDDLHRTHSPMTRATAGFEIQKRFATPTRTVATLDYQARLAYREHILDLSADPLRHTASRWQFETHNAYIDLHDILGPPGAASLRLGSFYQPFGLAQSTDTHAQLLQLSHGPLFGSKRDWQAALFGALTDHLDYNLAYLLGAGPRNRLDGQSGLLAARLSLNNDWLFRRGLEGGISLAAGQRTDSAALRRSPSVARATRGDPVIRTWRAGADIRQRLDTPAGPLTLSAEAAAGEDQDDLILSALAQADWLHPSRRWGAALQHTAFWQERARTDNFTDARLAAVATHYLRNDIGRTSLHWIALGIERQLHHSDTPEDTYLILQYYRYW